MTITKRLFLFLALLLVSFTAITQDAGRFTGTWEGAIQIPGSPLGVIVNLQGDDDALQGTIDIPMQGASDLPLDNMSVDSDNITFRIAGIPGAPTFSGIHTDERIEGTFTQDGQSFPFTIKRTSTETGETEEPAAVPAVETFLGSWEGAIAPESLNLRIGVTFEAQDGTMTGRYVVPMQGLQNNVTILDASDTAITFRLEGVPGNATFQSELTEGRLEGTFTQAGQSYPLVLERTDEPLAAEMRRPQEPEPPFPYREEEVTVPSEDINLAGTLTLPEGDGPFPAVLLLTGSGPQDRDETLVGHRPFLIIADHLTRAGFAVLRMDDRGVGASGGGIAQASYDDFVQDALAGITFLAEHPEIDASRIGLLGHSEGGYIAPAATTQSSDVAFVITLAGPAVPGLEVLELQNALIFEQAGASEEEIEAQIKYLRALSSALKTGDLEEARALTQARIEESFAALPEDEQPSPEERDLMIQAQLANLEAQWFRDFMLFDPQPYLRELQVPLLAIYGSLDIQVPPDQSVPALRALVEETDHQDVTIEVFEGLNHLMQPAETGRLEEYAQIETTIAPEVLELITTWLTERFGTASTS